MNMKTAQIRQANNKYTQDCIHKQMRYDRQKRKSVYDYEHLYHKPHFGPEQTDQTLKMDDKMYRSK